MRKIKFRAWDKNEGKMIDNFFIHATGYWEVFIDEDGGKEGLWEHSIASDYDLVIMQWTGLHDKNGKEIYEGDTVKDGKIVGIVKFKEGCFCLESDRGLRRLHTEVEVIGNIFEKGRE